MASSQTEALLKGMVSDVDDMIEAYGSLDSCSRHLVSIIQQYVSIDVSDIDVDSNKQTFDSAKSSLLAKMNKIVNSLDLVEDRHAPQKANNIQADVMVGRLVG